MNPILEIKGTKCKECKGKGKFYYVRLYSWSTCPRCEGKGKSPDIKIVRLEEFPACPHRYGSCLCQSTEYRQLPKKGNVLCNDKNVHGWNICTEKDCINPKFHLILDAKVMTVGEFIEEGKTFLEQTIRFKNFFGEGFDKNQKIVLLEGYDDN